MIDRRSLLGLLAALIPGTAAAGRTPIQWPPRPPRPEPRPEPRPRPRPRPDELPPGKPPGYREW